MTGLTYCFDSTNQTLRVYDGTQFSVVAVGQNTNGTDVISNVSINGVQNVKAWGAVCSTTTASATTVGGNNVVTVNAIGDFKIGQKVKLDHAGVANTIAAPTLTSVDKQAYGLNPAPRANLDALDTNPPAASGNCQTDALASAPGHNTACTTTYGYTIQATGQTGIGTGVDGMLSAQSAVVYVTNAASTLSVSNFNVLNWTDDANAVAYIVRRCTGAACTPTGSSIYAIVPTDQAFPTGSNSYFDFGNTFGHSEVTLTGSATAADLETTITNISGTSVTLAVAPTQTGTFTMHHDNSVPIQNAINASVTNTSSHHAMSAYVPACSSAYPISQAITFYGLFGAGLEGAGFNVGEQVGSSQIAWDGPIGGIVFNANKAGDARVRGIGFNGANAVFNTPGTFVSIDNYTGQGPGNPPASVGNPAPTNFHLEDSEVQEASVCVHFGGLTNDENAVVKNFWCDGPGIFGYWSNSQNTYNEFISGGQVLNKDFGTWFQRIGSFDISDINMFNNKVDFLIKEIETVGRIGGVVSENAQMFLYGGPGTVGILQVDNSRISPTTTPMGYVVNTGGTLFTNDTFTSTNTNASNNLSVSGAHFDACRFNDVLSNLNAGGAYPISQPGNLPITNVDGGHSQPRYIATRTLVSGQTVPGSVVEDTTIDACDNKGTVTTNQSIVFTGRNCQKYTTATTGLTYTLSTTNIQTDQVVTIESYITGAIAAGPLWATSSGSIKWTGGIAPTSSNAAGLTDIIRLKWDGSAWQEISRSMGNS